ncbi:hypothetical protein LTR85_012247 [Meristemomyces frigidus]|nr:hypothetical protein LTR85_012247 [Meristemomyces frigidus]
MVQSDKTVLSSTDKAHAGLTGEMQTDLHTSTRVAFETILDSAKILLADKKIKSILDKLDQVPALESRIRSRIEQDRLNDMARQQALKDYNLDRDSWDKKRDIDALKIVKRGQAEQIKAHEDFTHKQRLDIEGHQKKNQGLIKGIGLEKHKNNALKDALKQARAEIAQISEEKAQLHKAFLTLEKQADWSASQLQAAADLPLPLRDDSQM